MNNEWRKFAQSDGRPANEIIRERIEMLAAVFSRKISEEMIIVFQDALAGYPNDVLKKSFTQAERSLERFPTPKMMRSLCNENMPSESWRYHYKETDGTDPETGQPVKIWIDPDPIHKGEELLYRADDCPEGRAFLKAFKELCRPTKANLVR